jgi:predicted DNA-binding protein (MmcQ/YjbR family)
MDVDYLRDYVLEKPAVTEGFPFGDDVLVFKTANKLFLLVSLNAQPLQFNAKCNPDEALELREEFPNAVLPGFHMNKKHWNTVIINGTLSNKQLLQLIDNSYNLVAKRK